MCSGCYYSTTEAAYLQRIRRAIQLEAVVHELLPDGRRKSFLME